ncbi:MAG: RHS repeat-associated core domain-containing protein [Bacteroidia bacterium]
MSKYKKSLPQSSANLPRSTKAQGPWGEFDKRSLNLGDYRFGFNGKESDGETYGTGNIYDYGFRIYNPRLGKFLSVDPLSPEYPWYTPYQFAGNKPVNSVDLDGLEEKEAYDENEADMLRRQGKLDGRSITRLVGANPRDLNLNNPYDQSYLKSSWIQAEVNQSLTKQLFEYVGDASMMIGGMFGAVGMTYSNPVNISAKAPTKLESWFRGLSTTFRNLFRRGGNKLPTIKQVRASHIDEVAE